MPKEQEVIKRLNFHKEYARLSSNRVVISETDLETVLNMLKEKDRQINSKNGTINALQCALKERTEERDRKDDIVTKQNKIIDLMAERIEWLCKNFGILLDEEHDENFTQEDIKQYFERKSEEC